MPIWEFFVVLFLILLNGFFAMSELAIVSARRTRLEQMAREGNRGAGKALRLTEDPTGFLSTVQIGITLIGIFAGAYSGATFAGPLAGVIDGFAPLARWSQTIALTLVVVVTTYLSLIVGELVPKRLALRNAEAIAAFVATPMTWLARLGHPIVWFLRLSSDALLRLLRLHATSASTVTEEEVKAMIAEATDSGIFAETERDLIEGVLRFADRPVRVIMVPRHELAWLSATDPLDMVADAIRRHGHSRYPLCGGAGVDDILGIVHVRDVLEIVRSGGDLVSVARQPIYVSAEMPSLRLIEQFRATKVHMAVVVDEYGDLEGVVTPTDILISIAGDVPGETSLRDEPRAVRREDGSWLLDAGMPVDEVADLLGIARFHGQGYSTLAGFVLEQLRRVPTVGDAFVAHGWRFEVVDMDNRRVDKILAGRAATAPGSDAPPK